MKFFVSCVTYEPKLRPEKGNTHREGGGSSEQRWWGRRARKVWIVEEELRARGCMQCTGWGAVHGLGSSAGHAPSPAPSFSCPFLLLPLPPPLSLSLSPSHCCWCVCVHVLCVSCCVCRTYDAVPCGVVFLVEFLLDVRSHVLLDAVLAQRSGGHVHGLLLHLLTHVRILDHGTTQVRHGV